MSLGSWRRRYYPVAAHRVPKGGRARAMLRKWRGLRAPALARHGFYHGYRTPVVEGVGDADEYFLVNNEHCSYCLKMEHCSECPVCREGHGLDCDNRRSAYWRWLAKDDPEPMIGILTRLARREAAAERRARSRRG